MVRIDYLNDRLLDISSLFAAGRLWKINISKYLKEGGIDINRRQGAHETLLVFAFEEERLS